MGEVASEPSEPKGATGSPNAVTSRGRGVIAHGFRRVRSLLPQPRLLWICLVVLSAYGLEFLGGGLGVATAIALPLTAILVDVAFQKARFDSIRIPDGAIATGLFVALILPPIVPLAGAIAVTVAAITVKHTLRYRGRPWLNPAGVGVVLGAFLFGFAPAWWAAIDVELLLALGVLLLLWNLRAWRIPVSFLGAYAALAVLQRVLSAQLVGGALVPQVLLLATIDPAVLFFALFMVTEPRTAPSDPRAQPLYSGVVAAGAALLPVVLPTLAVLVALFAGNTLSVALRRRAAPNPSTREKGFGRFTSRRKSPLGSARWSLPRRAVAAVAVLLLVGWVAALTYDPLNSPAPIFVTSPGGAPPGGGGSGVSTSVCQKDNASIPSSTLSSLHRALGPSVIISYSTSTGVIVFYDPVNGVTVTETDLYEDYGFAEFNGDDYTNSGCVP
ncbi:MAG: RnfABCDGE type electron transport complex subunit D [Thermoplasmata archaeon]|nr:RnfABCDGE type electron transport complex subunit D [Thermoplasmata archaeon]